MPKRKATALAPMVTSIPITQARINLGSLVQRIHLNKEYFILEKDGIPVAGLMDIDEFEDYLELKDTRRFVSTSRKATRSTSPGRVAQRRNYLPRCAQQKGNLPKVRGVSEHDAAVCCPGHAPL